LDYLSRLRSALTAGGACLKNLIWDPRSAEARASCAATVAAWHSVFDSSLQIALGNPATGHNRLLLGWRQQKPTSWTALRIRLAQAGIPPEILGNCHLLDKSNI
jgi:hypothetical protein